jgi:hypothetical protein
MSADKSLPLDFVDYLCEARHVERNAALKLLADEVRSLSDAVSEACTEACAYAEGPRMRECT